MPPASRSGNWYTGREKTRGPRSRNANTLQTLWSRSLAADTPGCVRLFVGMTASWPGSVCRAWSLVGKIEESDGHWVLAKLDGSSGAPKKMEIEFGKTQEPGTILLICPEGWAGS